MTNNNDEKIQYPGVNDVLSGRGGHAQTHPGNLKFRTLVDSFKPRYDQATQHEKRELANTVLSLWRSQEPRGRFLAKTDPLQEDSWWHDIGDKAAKKRISQTLRERRNNPMIPELTIPDKPALPEQPKVDESPAMKALQEAYLPFMYQKVPPKEHLPLVEAIIVSTQDRANKIREIEEEIEKLKRQNMTQTQVEDELRKQQQQHLQKHKQELRNEDPEPMDVTSGHSNEPANQEGSTALDETMPGQNTEPSQVVWSAMEPSRRSFSNVPGRDQRQTSGASNDQGPVMVGSSDSSSFRRFMKDTFGSFSKSSDEDIMTQDVGSSNELRPPRRQFGRRFDSSNSSSTARTLMKDSIGSFSDTSDAFMTDRSRTSNAAA